MNTLPVVTVLTFFFCAQALPARADGPVRAGFAEAEIQIPNGVPLAGFGGGKRRLSFPDIFNRIPYAFWLKPAEGTLDPIRSKVAVLEFGSKSLVIVSLDLVGISRAMREAVLKELGPSIPEGTELILTATHTHSGPGSLAKNLLWETIAVDRFSRRFFTSWVRQVADTVRAALENRESAQIEYGKIEIKGLQQNRAGKPGHFDPMAQALVSRRANGTFAGAVVNFGVHATFHGTGNRKFSGDIAGSIERAVASALASEGQKPVVLYVNGAEGDVTPQRFPDLETYGTVFAEQTQKLWAELTPVHGGLRALTASIPTGSPSFNAKACINQKFLRRVLGWLRPSLKGVMPGSTDVTVAAIGDLALVTYPGEPTTSVGQDLVEAIRAKGFREVMLLGLGQDHLGYFTTPEEYRTPGYESCSSLYGKDGARRFQARALELVGKISSR